jgi:hypothetical protein
MTPPPEQGGKDSYGIYNCQLSYFKGLLLSERGNFRWLSELHRSH